MNLRQLHAIQTVAELGSVTAAATRLGLTQSAVSRIIAAVEAELGLALFERYRRRLVPTEHALHFVTRAGKIIRDMQELAASTRAIRQGRIDRLRVISVPPFLQGIVPRAVAQRVKSNPHLSVRVDIARRVDIPDWINSRDFDLAVVGLPVDRPEVKVEPLPPVEAVALVPREHPLAKQKVVRLQDILVGPLVTHSAGPLLRSELDRALAGQGSAAAPVVEASSGWLVCAMVSAGAGLAVMDPFTATARANSSLVVRALKPKIVLKYGLLTLRERPPIGEAVALAEEIRAQVARSLKEMQTRR